jgi:hypothetical protein
LGKGLWTKRSIFFEIAELAFAAAGEAAITLTPAGATTATTAICTAAIVATAAIVTEISAGRRRSATGAARGRGAAWARGALLFGAGFDDLQRAAANGRVVEAFHGGSGFVIIGHVHETEAAGAACFTIFDDTGVGDGAVGGELVLQLFVGERVRQVANIEVHLSLGEEGVVWDAE